ncbi:M20/M25/M40 family metallo-hydrolase [Terriglobus albidus]|uniref:M20/M25/M40 family metallo-hydrolase n=1 Tax=Terriglobus albidus TaxID=1592106 RepID=UPI0021DF60F8|nr:M20/M25/M40 family metallo-hydrolase [Terriglobus albidus]
MTMRRSLCILLCTFAANPVFSQNNTDAAARLKQTIETLSAPSMQGRGVGTEGLQRSAELIRNAFRSAGLKSGAADGSFFQKFPYTPDKSTGKEISLQNVVGVLQPADSSVRETIVIGAHYDHLGSGPAFSLAKGEQKHALHPGADDNASGVALLLELARHFAASGAGVHKRIVFIAFSGEEEGELGSKYYVAHPFATLADTATMINLDMVGRVRENIIGIAGNKSGDTFDAILDQAATASHLSMMRGGDDYPDDSDHGPFAAAGVPFLYICSGSHDDRHTPGDTADKINAPGMVEVANLMESVIGKLLTSSRPRFVTRLK